MLAPPPCVLWGWGLFRLQAASSRSKALLCSSSSGTLKSEACWRAGGVSRSEKTNRVWSAAAAATAVQYKCATSQGLLHVTVSFGVLWWEAVAKDTQTPFLKHLWLPTLAEFPASFQTDSDRTRRHKQNVQTHTDKQARPSESEEWKWFFF